MLSVTFLFLGSHSIPIFFLQDSPVAEAEERLESGAEESLDRELWRLLSFPYSYFPSLSATATISGTVHAPDRCTDMVTPKKLHYFFPCFVKKTILLISILT